MFIVVIHTSHRCILDLASQMTPSKNRSIPGRHRQRSAEDPSCPCTSCESSSGICDLDVWQGTTLDDEAARSGRRLLRPNLPAIKCKHWTQLRFPGTLTVLCFLMNEYENNAMDPSAVISPLVPFSFNWLASVALCICWSLCRCRRRVCAPLRSIVMGKLFDLST
ncbi:hypothetical protein GQ600_11634 [Phytophthora cactorum]|nr:hypothetical protein GQ600_11634 [Phytophthora cactorum]